MTPQDQLGGAQKRIDLVALNKSASQLADYPENTFAIAHGPHGSDEPGIIHRPYHNNVIPIFIGFQVTSDLAMTQDMIRWLKEYAPVGCADWASVMLLRDHGVPAFYSGDLMSDLASVLTPDLLDALAQELGQPELTGARATRPLAVNLTEALNALAALSQEKTYTGTDIDRFLAAQALGLEVTFTEDEKTRLEHEGLIDVPRADARQKAGRVAQKLGQLLAFLLAGNATKPAFQSFWPTLWQDELDAVETYLAQAPALPEIELNIEDLKQRVQPVRVFEDRPVPQGDQAPLHLLMAASDDFMPHFQATFEALYQHTPGPIICYLMTRGCSTEMVRGFVQGYERADFVQIPMDSVEYDWAKRNAHALPVPASMVDRLMAKYLLSEIDRLLYLDVDILVRENLRPLAETDMQGRCFAACPDNERRWESGEQIMRMSIGAALPPEAAFAASRMFRAQGSLDYLTANTGVLLMDLKQLRGNDIIERSLSAIKATGAHDQNALNMIIRGDFKVLPNRWNVYPTTNYEPNPAIVHYVGPVKQWGNRYRPYRNEWQAHNKTAQKRRAQYQDR